MRLVYRRIRCPIVTACDYCLMRGRERTAAVRQIICHSAAVGRLLASGASPHYSEIAPSTWADLCRRCDRRAIVFDAGM